MDKNLASNGMTVEDVNILLSYPKDRFPVRAWVWASNSMHKQFNVTYTSADTISYLHDHRKEYKEFLDSYKLPYDDYDRFFFREKEEKTTWS